MNRVESDNWINILSRWVTIKEVVRLDSAICSQIDRDACVMLLKNVNCPFLTNTIIFSERLYWYCVRWVSRRGFKLDKLHINWKRMDWFNAESYLELLKFTSVVEIDEMPLVPFATEKSIGNDYMMGSFASTVKHSCHITSIVFSLLDLESVSKYIDLCAAYFMQSHLESFHLRWRTKTLFKVSRSEKTIELYANYCGWKQILQLLADIDMHTSSICIHGSLPHGVARAPSNEFEFQFQMENKTKAIAEYDWILHVHINALAAENVDTYAWFLSIWQDCNYITKVEIGELNYEKSTSALAISDEAYMPDMDLLFENLPLNKVVCSFMLPKDSINLLTSRNQDIIIEMNVELPGGETEAENENEIEGENSGGGETQDEAGEGEADNEVENGGNEGEENAHVQQQRMSTDDDSTQLLLRTLQSITNKRNLKLNIEIPHHLVLTEDLVDALLPFHSINFAYFNSVDYSINASKLTRLTEKTGSMLGGSLLLIRGRSVKIAMQVAGDVGNHWKNAVDAMCQVKHSIVSLNAPYSAFMEQCSALTEEELSALLAFPAAVDIALFGFTTVGEQENNRSDKHMQLLERLVSMVPAVHHLRIEAESMVSIDKTAMSLTMPPTVDCYHKYLNKHLYQLNLCVPVTSCSTLLVLPYITHLTIGRSSVCNCEADALALHRMLPNLHFLQYLLVYDSFLVPDIITSTCHNLEFISVSPPVYLMNDVHVFLDQVNSFPKLSRLQVNGKDVFMIPGEKVKLAAIAKCCGV